MITHLEIHSLRNDISFEIVFTTYLSQFYVFKAKFIPLNYCLSCFRIVFQIKVHFIEF